MDVLRVMQANTLENVLCLIQTETFAVLLLQKLSFLAFVAVHRTHDIGSSIVGQRLGRYIRLKACCGINVVVDHVTC